MNNNNCLLVEFVNENNSIAVGFREWLTIKCDDEMLQELVNKGKSVQISWPSCEIKSATKMKKIIKTLTEKDWTTTVIKVLAFGGMYIYIVYMYICNTYIYMIKCKCRK